MFYAIFTVLIFCFSLIQGTPIEIKIDRFEDTWDYKTVDQNGALLPNNRNSHTLPLFLENESKVNHQTRNNGNNYISKESPVIAKLTCSVCKLGALLFQTEVKKGSSVEEIKEKFVSICVGFNIQTEVVCTGIYDVFSVDLLPAVNMTELGPAQMCSLALGDMCKQVENPTHEWEVNFPEVEKPTLKPRLPYVKDAPVLKVLQITDTHLDLNYVEGSPSNCAEPICCHSYSAMEENVTPIPAGKWGSYAKCDMPKIFIENMLQHIAETHKDIDYIIWTGDLPAHDIWNQTKEGNLNILKESVRQMKDAFPDTPIFPALGNHEGVPAGSFPPPWVDDEEHSISWLYNELNEQWSDWLPPSANKTVIHGAFYSVLVRPGLRIISMNTNYCMHLNWFLYVNSTDPAQELEWLVYELQKAEDNNEIVHIIGHIPPGESDCFKVWSENYYKIIDRYEDIIAAQYFGHTHFDEFKVFYDNDEYKRPTSIAYIGPSVTTYEDLNPGYRIYYIDGEHNETTWEVLDFENWIVDLEEANESGEPRWFRLYTAKEVYGMDALRPENWSKLINDMSEDIDLFDLFYRLYYKDSNRRPKCSKKCRKQIICDLKSAKSHHSDVFCPKK